MKLLKIFQCKCPNCYKGNIFKNPGNLLLLRMPKMNEKCPLCHFQFEKETGFFFGAMYVSYGIASAIMISAMAIMWGILDIHPLTVFITIAVVIVLSSNYNFKLSRALWIYMFYERVVK